MLGVLEFLGIIDTVDRVGGTLVQEVEIGGSGQFQTGLVLGLHGFGHELVEDVEVTLVGALEDHTRLLEQVDQGVGTSNLTTGVELQFNEFTETGRVVVLGGLGVTEGLKDGVELQQLLFQGSLSSRTTGNGSEVLNYLLGVFSLTSSRLTAIMQNKY